MRTTVRLMAATTCLATPAAGTVAASAGRTPLDLESVSGYLATHAVATVDERLTNGAWPKR